jgi:hypothetical protein
VTLTATTLACDWICGQSITINHVAGAVAPVNKTTTYGTVTSIPGEPAKCWITRNLGASQQAASVSDATEPPAGWYWQFNGKQGYKHDGTTCTPNTSCIGVLLENSDWQTSKDPCTLELGSPWRMPTESEWGNVDAAGYWTGWNDPYGSNLKLHAAGNLIYTSGSLNHRGSRGNYWSSTQNSTDDGWSLDFSSGGSSMDTNRKAYGFSVRCLRD